MEDRKKHIMVYTLGQALPFFLKYLLSRTPFHNLMFSLQKCGL